MPAILTKAGIEDDRDEPPAAGAARRRIDEEPSKSHPVEGNEGKSVSVEAELLLLRQLYGARIEIARRNAPRPDRAAAIKALRLDLKAAILAVTARRRIEQATRRDAALLRRMPLRAPELNK